MKVSTEEARTKAEARFQQSEQRKSDAEKVMAEVQAAKKAEVAKTVRLRALRLASEEAARAEKAAAPAPAPKKRSRAAPSAG